MGSKHKRSRMEQKVSFEQRLEERLSYLSKKGTEHPEIDKDVIVKKLRADINAVNTRLKAITANEKRTEELARIKAEKAEKVVAPREDQEIGKNKKSKEAPAEGKEKKKKKKDNIPETSE